MVAAGAETTPLSKENVNEDTPASTSSRSSIPIGPDGGYGWVIVGCSFMCIFTIDGIITTYALLLPELNQSFQTTPTLTSMGNSLILGIFLLMGMPTSCLINKHGCRIVGFLGGLIAACGLVASSMSSDIWSFLPTFGVIGEFEKSMTKRMYSSNDVRYNSDNIRSCDSQGLCDRSLLTNKAFLLLAAGAMLTQMGQYIPMVFLGDYALQIGLDRADVSVILAVFGVVNTLARLLAGALTNIPKLTPLLICNIGTFCCAIILFLFSFCTTFWTLCAFAVSLAVFIGFFPPMQPLMVLDYLGLDRLTSAFGLITCAKGPAAIFGPPLAGNLYQLTQSYSVSNAFAGGLFLLSAIVQTLIPFCNTNQASFRITDKELCIDELDCVDTLEVIETGSNIEG